MGHATIEKSNTPELHYAFFVIGCELQIYFVDGINKIDGDS